MIGCTLHGKVVGKFRLKEIYTLSCGTNTATIIELDNGGNEVGNLFGFPFSAFKEEKELIEKYGEYGKM